jgi:hypothetical protein
VRGKFVLVSAPQQTCRPDDNWREYADSASFERMRAARTGTAMIVISVGRADIAWSSVTTW